MCRSGFSALLAPLSENGMLSDEGMKTGSDQLLEQSDDLLPFRGLQGGDGFRGDLVRLFDGAKRHAAADRCQMDHATPPVFRVLFDFHVVAASQPVDHAFDRRRIEVDQPAELILRAGSDLREPGECCELGQRQTIDHVGREYDGVTLHRHTHQKSDLVLDHITSGAG
jgi:hypothetical protein